MKRYLIIFYSLCICAFLYSCKQEPNTDYADEYRSVYMAKAVDVQNFIFQESTGSDKIFVGANYGGLDYAPEDITVHFEVDLSLVSAYNEKYGTNYLPLPVDNFVFSKKEGTIKKGELQTSALPIDIDFEQLLTFTDYLLPVKISSVSGNIPLKEDLKTVYYIIEVRSDPVPVKFMMLGKGGVNNDMDKLAQIIKDADPDIVLIREIDKNTTRSGATNNWPEILAQKISFNHVFVPSILSYQGGQYGMAVYSKHVIANANTYLLVANGTNQSETAERGPFIVMDVSVGGKVLKVAAVHTNANATARATQLGEIIEILGEEGTQPFVLIGNMNTNPNGGDSYAALSGIGFGAACTACPPNFSAANPASWSDMTLFRPSGRFSVASHIVGSVAQTVGGTHLPVFTTLNVYF